MTQKQMRESIKNKRYKRPEGGNRGSHGNTGETNYRIPKDESKKWKVKPDIRRQTFKTRLNFWLLLEWHLFQGDGAKKILILVDNLPQFLSLQCGYKILHQRHTHQWRLFHCMFPCCFLCYWMTLQRVRFPGPHTQVYHINTIRYSEVTKWVHYPSVSCVITWLI